MSAYLNAAKTIDTLAEPVEDLLRGEGFSALLDLPGIGEGIARSINEYVMTGRMSRLESLQTGHDPIALFEQIPGIGPRSAHRIIETLHIDKQYRKKAEDGELPTIAPKRFNPGGEAWLPIMHATKQGWHFTALYSNTARAHQLERVKDWVVIFFYDGQHHEGQHTVVTETRGAAAGRRVVRGREKE